MTSWSAAEPRVSIIIPTYEERHNLAALLERIARAIKAESYEVIVVDDNSPDGTAEKARELSGLYPLRCIVRHDERGLATAVMRGFREARGEICVVMDADLSHPPEALPLLCAQLENDASLQMAIGSRFVPGGKVDLHWPLHRRLVSLAGRLMARPLTKVRDMAAGFFAVRRKDLRLDWLRPVGYKIALELIVRHGWRQVVEIPITFTDRAAGKTKLSLAEQLRYLRHLCRLYAFVLSGRSMRRKFKP